MVDVDSFEMFYLTIMFYLYLTSPTKNYLFKF